MGPLLSIAPKKLDQDCSSGDGLDEGTLRGGRGGGGVWLMGRGTVVCVGVREDGACPVDMGVAIEDEVVDVVTYTLLLTS